MSKYSIKPILRLDKMKFDGTAPLYIQIIVPGEQPYRKPLGYSVKPEHFSKTDGKVTKLHPNYHTLNKLIQYEVMQIQNHISNIILAHQCVTIRAIRQLYEDSDDRKAYLFEFAEERFKLWENKKVYNTMKCYYGMLNHLKRYTKNLLLTEVNHKFIEDFEYYLRSNGNDNGGVHNKLKCLKTVMNSALKQGLIKTLPFKNYPLKRSQPRKVFCYPEELKALEQADLREERERSEQVKDMYLIGCYTGLRISDILKLSWENIDGDMLTIIVTKTKQEFSIKLIPKAVKIISKYKSKNNGTVFPRISSQKVNKKLKTIAERLGIKKRITFHSSRHTFASLLHLNKVDVVAIKELLDHRNVAVTMNYVHSLKKKVFEQLEVIENT